MFNLNLVIMPKKFIDKSHLIVKTRDYETDSFIPTNEAIDRMLFLIRCDMELKLKSLISIMIVNGTHVRYYFESNHHQKHCSVKNY